jgi:ATP-dependent Clp protease ATP-binding subunit ClpB
MLKDKFTLSYTPEALEWLAQLGYDPQFGARPIKRVIQRKVLNELSKYILSNSVTQGSEIKISVKGGEIVFDKN